MVFFFQILIDGLATGAIYALIAVGYSVTFTTMRVLNFGLGMWVMAGGMLTYTLFASWGWPILVTAIVLAALLGLMGIVAERLTVRPFVAAGSEGWVMATLAVGLLFVNIAELVWGRNSLRVPAFVGQDALHFGAFAIYPQHLLIITSSIGAFLALDFFYYRTLWGKAFRAVAHSADTARLMGIDAGGVATASYALACVLAGIAGMLVAPITLADPQMGTVLGLKAFVIPIVAGLGSPRGILLCGVAYGALEGLISGYLFGGIRDILAFSLMIAVLYWRPDGLFGTPSAGTGMSVFATRLAVLIGALALLAMPVLVSGSFFKFMLILVFIYTIVSIGLNLLIGYAGQFSLGHAGLMAIGAYVSAIVSLSLAGTSALVLIGGNVWVGMIAGVVAAGIAGAALAFPVLRLKGPYLAMVTVAFGWIVWKVLLTWTSVTGGDLGITAIPRPRIAGHVFNVTDYYYLSGAFAAIALLLQRNLVVSDFGRKLRALKSNEAALESVGVDVHREKVVIFVISAMFAGLGGALFAHLQNFINPDNFQFVNSVFFLLTILFGGPGTLSGPLFGATLLTLVPELLHGAEQYRLLIFSLIILVTLFYLPHGVAGLLPAPRGKGPSDAGLEAIANTRKRETPLPRTGAMNGQNPIVSIRGVSKTFGGIVALNEVDLVIAPATVHALIGPNGAGKTTLVNIISGVYRPDRGTIEIAGQKTNLSSLHHAARQGSARTFQTIKLFGGMTVREHVMVGCEMQSGATLFDALFRTGRSRNEERRRRAVADELLALVGLEAFADAAADSLAYGHRRLLEMARALATRPRLLLLDEPAAGLVAGEIEMLAGVIEELRATGLAVLLVEHHMDLVTAVSDTITVLDYGRVICRGDVETVRNDPLVGEAYLGVGGEHELSVVAG